MNCPQCGHSMQISDRICRRCRYLAEEDITVDFEPPRAKKPQPRDHASLLNLARLQKMPKTRRQLSPKFLGFAGVVPGLGHFLSGRWRMGAVYAAAIIGLASFAARDGGPVGMGLIGLAAAIHAFSIYQAWKPEGHTFLIDRLAAIGIIQLLLLFIYVPLVNRLGQAQVVMMQRGDVIQLFVQLVIGVVFLLVLLLVLAAISHGIVVTVSSVYARLRGTNNDSEKRGDPA